MDKRTLFYYGKLYVQSIQSGENYHDLKRTITVNLLDFNYLPHKQYHSVYRLYEESGRDLLTDVLEVHFIEFPKFEKVLKDLKNPLHRWLMYFDENITDEKLKELMEMDPVIKKTEERLKWLSSDDETRRLYEYREHSRIERNSIFDDGRQEGELTALLKVAENLMQRGASLEEILEITGLSEEQLQKLK